MIKFSRKKREERGKYYWDQIKTAQSNRSGFFERIDKYRDMVYRDPGGMDASGEDAPWEGAADIHLPLILDKIETGVPKIMSALWRANPFVHIDSPGNNIDYVRTKNVEEFAHWAFHNDIPDMYNTLENWLRNMFIDGTAFMKIGWERSWRRAVEVHVLPNIWKAGDEDYFGNVFEEDQPKTVEDYLFEIFGFGDTSNSVYSIGEIKGDRVEVKFTEEDRIYEAIVYFEDSDKLTETKCKVNRKVIAQDSPSVKLVDFEDLVIPFRTPSIQRAKWVAHRTWYTYREVEEKVASGDWTITKKDMKTLHATERNADHESRTEQYKDDLVGETGNTGTEKRSADMQVDPNMILIWEVHTKDYEDGASDPVDMIIFISDDIHKVVGAEFSDEFYPHGQRPFIEINYIQVPGRTYGIGMAEILYAINLEMDHTVSSIHNSLDVITNPWFFYTPYGFANNSGLLRGIKPGQGVPTADPNGIVFPRFNQNPEQLYHGGFQMLQGYADRLTFSPSVGGSNNYRNAPRTARATMALMDAAEERLSSIIEKMQAGPWKSMVSQVISLYGMYVSIDKWYRATGETEARRIPPKDLRENLLYSFSGSLTNVNRDSQRAMAERIYSMVRNDALFQMDPHAAQALLRYTIDKFIEDDSTKQMVPQLPGEGGFQHPPMDQALELRTLSEGINLDVLPTDDDNEHLQEIERFYKSDAFQQLTPEQVKVVRNHEARHKEALNYKMQHQQNVQMQQARSMAAGAPVADEYTAAEGVPSIGGELSQFQGGPNGGGAF